MARIQGALEAALALTVAACGSPAPGQEQLEDISGLPIPPAGQGLQIATPELVLEPGDERFHCYGFELPLDADVDVGRFVSRAHGVHHLVLALASQPDGQAPDAAAACEEWSGHVWTYGAFSRDHDLTLPAGVGIALAARQVVRLDAHYINAGSAKRRAGITLNLEFSTNVVERAGAMLTYASFEIPPLGSSVVAGTCTPPPDVSFFAMTTHTHKRGTLATIQRLRDGQPIEDLVRTEDWRDPQVRQWTGPYLHFSAGEQLYYSCSFENDTHSPITSGASAENDEMCVTTSYYFPAVWGTFTCES